MDDKSKEGRVKDGSASAPPHRRKGGLKFHFGKKGGLKFKPRVPTKKAKRVPTMELEVESKFDKIDEDLLLKLRPQSTSALERRSKAENNEARVQVAFGPADPSAARSFHTPESSSSVKKEKDVHLLSKSMLSDVTTSAAKLPKQCAEPQDLTHPYYNYPPITLPLRRDYSRVPEICDDDDFSEFSSSGTQDGELTVAQELGLMVESAADADMDTSGGVETEGTKSKENDKKSRLESMRGCKLKDLPGGLMGKVLIYKSGKVKMRLGDALFDVSAGIDCAFAQEAVAINGNKKHCCSLGQVSKGVVVTPDVDCLVDSVNKVE